MASMVKMVSLAAVLSIAAVLITAPPVQASSWAPVKATDMVPVTPAERVLVPIPSGAAGAPICLQCRCCSKSSPSTCEITTCCSTFDCDPAGKCNLVQTKCGCTGC